MVNPTASLSHLNRADGSATYKCPATGYNILSAVNGPVELPARREALKPEEATVDVFVKPGTTTGGVGERAVENHLRSVLGKIVLGREKGFARRGVIVTLNIVGGENVQRGDSVSTLLVSRYSRPNCQTNQCSTSPYSRLSCTPAYSPCFPLPFLCP